MEPFVRSRGCRGLLACAEIRRGVLRETQKLLGREDMLRIPGGGGGG